jgi:hypothetical protein
MPAPIPKLLASQPTNGAPPPKSWAKAGARVRDGSGLRDVLGQSMSATSDGEPPFA